MPEGTFCHALGAWQDQTLGRRPEVSKMWDVLHSLTGAKRCLGQTASSYKKRAPPKGTPSSVSWHLLDRRRRNQVPSASAGAGTALPIPLSSAAGLRVGTALCSYRTGLPCWKRAAPAGTRPLWPSIGGPSTPLDRCRNPPLPSCRACRHRYTPSGSSPCP